MKSSVNKVKVLFLHGLESSPGGTKVKYLEKCFGCTILNPALPKSSFKNSIEIAQKIVDEQHPDLVIGSSRGGAVAMCLNLYKAKLLLIAPAYSRFEESISRLVPQSTTILHSKNDEIIPFRDSEILAARCSAKLMEVGECHRMSDEKALMAIAKIVSENNINRSEL